MYFEEIDFADCPWEILDRFADRTVFQTKAWVEFLADSQNGTPVVAVLRDGSRVAGYFTALVVTRMGVRILGSSFAGWTTPYIGFNLSQGVARRQALASLSEFAIEKLKCHYFEVCDRFLSLDDGGGLGLSVRYYDSYVTDLTRPEDDLFSRMTSACRRCIRKAAKTGVRIQESNDLAFAHDYYEQLEDVFAKQSLVPTYKIDRVRKLIEHLAPTGHLLLLRARDPSGRCIGTGIYPGMNDLAQFWGNASFRWGQEYRPNEALHWYAMRYWKRRGVRVFDWGGEGEYKEKFGAEKVAIPRFSKSRFRLLGVLRDEAEKLYRRKQRLSGWLRSRRFEPSPRTIQPPG